MDGPEEAEGVYEYGGRVYRLEERDSERWTVTADDGQDVGVLVALAGPGRNGPEYTIDLPGEEGRVGEPSTDDWRRALQTLIDESVPPVGG
ncbi:hypothetical protein [Orlajensenia leifsoniae]|uniref:Uncharacterized protein n=1 Tax=Orlajensenia leifsoniae TaxID=2561933 RepID=A0A4Y9R808_9MICO|nr:hypothetical protein [Leifsonia flava]TFW00189.1 hypothetical protein E4M00_03105 [Leifsonia flava]